MARASSGVTTWSVSRRSSTTISLPRPFILSTRRWARGTRAENRGWRLVGARHIGDRPANAKQGFALRHELPMSALNLAAITAFSSCCFGPSQTRRIGSADRKPAGDGCRQEQKVKSVHAQFLARSPRRRVGDRRAGADAAPSPSAPAQEQTQQSAPPPAQPAPTPPSQTQTQPTKRSRLSRRPHPPAAAGLADDAASAAGSTTGRAPAADSAAAARHPRPRPGIKNCRKSAGRST